MALWRKNFDVLAEGYFLTARAAFPLLKLQRGGSIIFIGSKNGVAAATNASAYASAKAASLHLARCLALEGAPHGIRVNTVNPDAVIDQKLTCAVTAEIPDVDKQALPRRYIDMRFRKPRTPVMKPFVCQRGDGNTCQRSGCDAQQFRDAQSAQCAPGIGRREGQYGYKKHQAVIARQPGQAHMAGVWLTGRFRDLILVMGERLADERIFSENLMLNGVLRGMCFDGFC